MNTSLASSTSSPSMFQGRAAPSDWMIGVFLESPSSSVSSSDQQISERGRIFTADTQCVSTNGKLNYRKTSRTSLRLYVCQSYADEVLRSLLIPVKQLVFAVRRLSSFLFTVLICDIMIRQQGAAETSSVPLHTRKHGASVSWRLGPSTLLCLIHNQNPGQNLFCFFFCLCFFILEVIGNSV